MLWAFTATVKRAVLSCTSIETFTILITSLYIGFGRKLRPHGRDRPFTSWFVQRPPESLGRRAPKPSSGRSPNGCQGRGSVREARICKDGPYRGRRRTSVRDQAESRYYVGVDVSKERLDVAFRPTSRR